MCLSWWTYHNFNCWIQSNKYVCISKSRKGIWHHWRRSYVRDKTQKSKSPSKAEPKLVWYLWRSEKIISSGTSKKSTKESTEKSSVVLIIINLSFTMILQWLFSLNSPCTLIDIVTLYPPLFRAPVSNGISLGLDSSLLSVSCQMGRRELAAFTKFARDVRPQSILLFLVQFILKK